MAAARKLITSGDYTTTSATFADVDSSNLSITLATSGRRVLVAFSGIAFVGPTVAGNVSFDFLVDGVRQGGTEGLMILFSDGLSFGSNDIQNPSFSYLTAVLSAGIHTFKPQWRVSASTATLRASATAPTVFTAQEVQDFVSDRKLITAGVYTTSSGTFADIDAANLSITLSTGARRLLVSFSSVVFVGGFGGGNVALDLLIDGVRQGGGYGLLAIFSDLSNQNGSIQYLTPVLSAGSHTIKLQWRIDGNGATMKAGIDVPVVFGVIEVA